MKRSLSLRQVISINTIDMVGIGPFLSVAGILFLMPGYSALIPWIIGAMLAFVDAMTWSQLGTKWPEAGGSYVFLQKTYGENSWGRVMSFLFIWQTMFQASFVVDSAAVGFAGNMRVFFPAIDSSYEQVVASGVIILAVFLLYRKINSIGKLSSVLAIIVLVTLVLIIGSGFLHFSTAPATAVFNPNVDYWSGFKESMGMTVYSFLGYYNVCHLGSEIQHPEKNVPRSMFWSIAIITVLYLLLQSSIIPFVSIIGEKNSGIPFATLFSGWYGREASVAITILILVVAFSSLYSVLLGYSRIPYRAAVDGNFFSIFARLHPTKDFPHISLLAIGGISVLLLFFKLSFKDIAAFILTFRILVQFIGQTVGLILFKYRHPNETFPYVMWMFPIPAIVGIVAWIALFTMRKPFAQEYAMYFLLAGMVVYVANAYILNKFPFPLQPKEDRSPRE